jgi:hypothetical protein
MGRPEGIDPRVIDQNIDTISEFDRSFRHIARARSVAKVRGYEIVLASCCADFGNRFLAALRVATHDQNLRAKLSQLVSQCRWFHL